jgi:hypothetical protein
MWNLIGIYADGSESIIADEFASWCEAFDYCVRYSATSVCDIGAPRWYRFDKAVA